MMKIVFRWVAFVLFVSQLSVVNAQLPEILEKDILDSYNWVLDVARSTECKTKSTLDEKDIVETKVNQCQFVDEFEMYPNPANEFLTISFKASKRSTKLLITSLDGRNVLDESVSDFDGIYSNQIDISAIPPGAYIFSIIQEKEAFIRKLIIN